MNKHIHDFDQITNMLRGKMKWTIEGEGEYIVGPGDVMVMKAGVAHSGEVFEEAEYLDIFVPPRQDFLEVQEFLQTWQLTTGCRQDLQL